MATTPTPPLPRRYTKQFQQAQKQKRAQQNILLEQQKKQLEEKLARENITNVEEPSEQKKVLDYYLREGYSPRLAEAYKDLYVAEKELEELKKSGANFQKVFEQEKKINSIKQDIGRTSSAGGRSQKTVEEKQKLKDYVRQLNEAGFKYDYTTGKVFGEGKKSPEYLFIDDKPVVGGYSSTSGESVFLTSGGASTQIPASFAQNYSSEGLPVSRDIPKGTLTTDYAIGVSESQRFTKYIPKKEEVVRAEFSAEEITQPKKWYTTPEGIISYSLNRDVVEPGKKIINKYREEREKQENQFPNLNKSLSAKTVRKKLSEQPEVFIKKSDEAIKGTVETLVGENEKARIAGIGIASTFQYAIPVYGQLKIGALAITDIQKERYEKLPVYGLGLLGSGAIYGAQKGLTFLQPLAPTAVKTIGTVGGPALGIGALTLLGIDLSKKLDRLTNEKYETIASETLTSSQDVGRFSFGFSAGNYGLKQFEKFYFSKKYEYISPEKIIPKEVLSGRKTFPEFSGTPKQLVKEFSKKVPPFKEKGMFTATTSRFSKNTEVEAGLSETPGIYVSPKISPLFLRIKGFELENYNITIFPNLRPGQPIAYRIAGSVKTTPSSVIKLFGNKQLIKSVSKRSAEQIAGNKAFSELPKGFAYVSPQFTLKQKVEAEAVIPVGNILTKTSPKTYYSTFRGTAFKIEQYKILSKRELSGLSKKSLEDLAKQGSNTLAKIKTNTYYNQYYISSRPSSVFLPLNFGTFFEEKERVPLREPSRVISSSLRNVGEPYTSSFYREPVFSTPSRITSSSGSSGSSVGSNYTPPSSSTPNYTVPSTPPYTPPSSPPSSPYSPLRPSVPKTFIKQKNNFTEARKGSVLGQAFRVQTKKGGKIVTLKERFTYEDAVNYGANIADRTARASFRVVEAEGFARQIGISPSRTKFRLSKQKNGFYVEPEKLRLNVRSERYEVSMGKLNNRKGLFRL